MKKNNKKHWLTKENIGARGYELIRFFEFVFIGFLGFHLCTQVNHCANTITDMVSPSPKRKEFQGQFGFPLRGWKEDIEGNPERLSGLAAVVHYELLTRPFDLASLRIRSDSYLKRSFIEQMKHLRAELSANYTVEIAHYYADSVILNTSCSNSTARHEIKHAKADEIEKRHPDFLQRWKELAKDEKGNSLYVGSEWKKLFPAETERLGFVSEYSRKNVDEDIAELCEAAENYPYRFEIWLEGRWGKNHRIIEKVKLAQEVKLLPPEFSEYIKLRIKRREIYERGLFIKDWEKAEDFLEQSGLFLEKYPKTVYQCELRKDRGDMFKDKSLLMLEDDLRKAIDEYNLALDSPYKDPDTYPVVLNDLAFCYEKLLHRQKASLYKKANEEYHKRFKNGDVKITITGVNDFLEDRL